ncbi:VWA domain-containing protein [Thalassoglobus sp. JC818]|uniref:VWA domain-containing protein n=1 Tax=Thalassoglobus sp. JC818 TaxID=3232136 RepID=UPI0034582461
MTDNSSKERSRRWRMVLGKESDPPDDAFPLEAEDKGRDDVLQALYDSNRQGGLGSSCPNVNRWLGDIRQYFSESNVKLMQRDALERLNLHEMLLQPETLEQVEPDIHLVATLLALKSVIPAKTKETARQVVRKVVEEVEKKIRQPMVEAVRGAFHRATRNNRPKPNEIDWNRTIKRNLKNFLPEQKAIIPEKLVGYGRRRSAMRDLILCVDQSGSMATSVVYSSLFASVLASIHSLRTNLVVFDTEVVDLSELLQDPVDTLFGAQLGGGTDINRAVAYCQSLIQRPQQTVMILITDLYEGGNANELLQRIARIVHSGVNLVCLLALNDEGAPSFDDHLSRALASLGVPAFACTPDHFPDLIAAAIDRKDLTQWAANHDLITHGDFHSQQNPS